jgi:anti-sigma factor RsiW
MIDAEKLNALVDNELDPAERAEVEALLASDPKAAAQVGSLRNVKTALQDNVRPIHCEDEWKACVKRLNEIDGARKTKFVVDKWAWAMCSALFLFIFSVGLYNRSNPGVHAGTGELTRAGIEKPIRDVYRWLKSEFGSAPSIPKQQLHIVGAREGTIAGRPLANFHLRDTKGDLGLVMVPGSVRVEGVSRMDDGIHYSCETGEANSVVWNDSGIVMVLTGKRDVDELRNIAKSIELTANLSVIP